MLFEHTMMKFFGKKAYQTVSQHNSPQHRREWLIKFAKTAIKRVDSFEADNRHKKRLITLLDGFISDLKSDKEPDWRAFYHLIGICGCLLGYRDGAIIYDPIYAQSARQYYTSIILDGGDPLQDHYDKKNCIEIRLSVVKDLKSKGLNNQLIALVLNTTEYKIKNLCAISIAEQIRYHGMTGSYDLG